MSDETTTAAPAATDSGAGAADPGAAADSSGDVGGAAAAAAAAEEIRLKLRGLDGAEKEYTPKEIEAMIQNAKKIELAAHKRSEKSAVQLKSMTEFVERLRHDPLGALRLIGHDPDSLAERHLAARLEEMSTPEEVRREKQLARENEILKRQIEESRTAEESKRSQAAADAAKSKYYEDFGAALTAAGLPVKVGDANDDEYFQAMARIVLRNREERRRAAEIGIEDSVPVVTYEQAARQVIEQAIARANRVLGSKKGPELTTATADHLAAALKGGDLPKKPHGKAAVSRLNEAMGKAAAADDGERYDVHAFRRSIFKN